MNDIRLRRLAGEKVSRIVAYLATLGLCISQIVDYLDQAFCLSGDRTSLLLMPAEADGVPNVDVLDRRFGADTEPPFDHLVERRCLGSFQYIRVNASVCFVDEQRRIVFQRRFGVVIRKFTGDGSTCRPVCGRLLESFEHEGIQFRCIQFLGQMAGWSRSRAVRRDVSDTVRANEAGVHGEFVDTKKRPPIG